jgi:predicted metal-binding protein
MADFALDVQSAIIRHAVLERLRMNRELLEQRMAELPLYIYDFIDPAELEFSDRIRWICETECPMYGKSWACPPGVGTVEQCKKKCHSFENCLLISSIVEVRDIANMEETLATRGDHEELTNQVRDLMREQGVDPFILSSEACALCERCAILDGEPCRMPEKMHPCVESQGINIIPVLESRGLEFQFGANVVTWVSLLLY